MNAGGADPRIRDEKLVVLGRISGLHGVQGWIKVFSETRPRDNILSYDPWYLRTQNGWEEYKLQAGRTQGKTLVVKLQHCNDRESARQLMGREIAVPRSQLGFSEAEQGEYFWVDLLGMRVVTEQGVELGKVDHLFETGSNDVMVVHGDKERLLPWIWNQVIKDVALQDNRITVNWDPEF